MAEKIICTQCGAERPEKEFFMKKDHTRYPICKNCLTMYIDNNDPETFKGILEKFDVPYIESVGKDKAQQAYDKNPLKFGSGSVIGRYLREMNMQQYRNCSYADTVRLAVEAEEKAKAANERVALTDEEAQEEFMNLQAQLDAGEISQAEFNTRNPLTRGMSDNGKEKVYTFNQDPAINEDDVLNEMTPEEQRAMRIKGGDNYKPSEGLQMEEMYLEYENEYEVDIDRKSVIKQICQVYLKMCKALAVDDTNAYKALAATYDSLRKSASFTKAQNKEDKTQYLNSVGEIIKFCEREGGIIDQLPDPDEYPQDKIDFSLKDMKAYNRNLVVNELGLGDLIESYIKKLEETERQKQKDLDEGLYTSIEEELEDQVTEQEAEDFQNYLDNEVEEEAARLLEMLGDTDGA